VVDGRQGRGQHGEEQGVWDVGPRAKEAPTWNTLHTSSSHWHTWTVHGHGHRHRHRHRAQALTHTLVHTRTHRQGCRPAPSSRMRDSTREVTTAGLATVNLYRKYTMICETQGCQGEEVGGQRVGHGTGVDGWKEGGGGRSRK
jgi:hypothetical protein